MVSVRSRDHRTSIERLRDDGGRLDRPKDDGTRPSSGKVGHHLSTNVTPVKVSRKDLRPMSEEEIKMRRSNLKESQTELPLPHGNTGFFNNELNYILLLVSVFHIDVNT